MTIRGDLTLGKTSISLKAMLRTIRHEGHGFFVEPNHLGADYADQKSIEGMAEILKELEGVLGMFQQLFHIPTGLPPNRHMSTPLL